MSVDVAIVLYYLFIYLFILFYYFFYFYYFFIFIKVSLIIKKKGFIFGCMTEYEYGLVTWLNPVKPEWKIWSLPNPYLYPDIHPNMISYFFYLQLLQIRTITLLHTSFFCDDLESRLTWRDKNTSIILQVFDSVNK